MKKMYLFAIVINLMFVGYAQSDCETAYSSLDYANSHITKAYDSKLYADLKYSAKNAKKSLEKAESQLINCDCQDTKESIRESIDLLDKTANAPSVGEAQFYVYKTTELVKKSITDLNLCTSMGSEGKDLLTLQHQQLELEQQRLALKQKEEEINLKIAEKARKELELKKVQLIVKNHKLIEDSLEVYSETLSACDCNTNVDAPKFDTKIKAKPLAEIKEHYINTIIKLSDDFSSKLRDCRKKAVETIATRQ